MGIGTLRQWLQENDYADVLGIIDAVIERWAKQGLKTRRNWWDILAGHENGNPHVVAGRTFPILRAARRRKGWSDIPTALQRNPREKPLPVKKTGRWSHN